MPLNIPVQFWCDAHQAPHGDLASQRASLKGGEDIIQASANFWAMQSYSFPRQLILLHVMYLF